MAVTEEQYQAHKEARAALTQQTLAVTEGQTPTPTQEENDKLRLGLMHVDEKKDPNNPEMPPVAVQQAAVEHKMQNAAVPDRPTPAPGAPTNVDVPHLGGNGAVGETLTCTKGNWHGEPTGYAYAWKSDGAAIAGTTGDSYVVAAGDVGKSITCLVTATNAAGSTQAPPSNAVSVGGEAGGTRMTGRTR